MSLLVLPSGKTIQVLLDVGFDVESHKSCAPRNSLFDSPDLRDLQRAVRSAGATEVAFRFKQVSKALSAAQRCVSRQRGYDLARSRLRCTQNNPFLLYFFSKHLVGSHAPVCSPDSELVLMYLHSTR